MDTEVKTSYTLEMLKPDDLRPKCGDFPDLRVERMETRCPELNKFLHTVVGCEWRWGGRAEWGEDEWRAYADRVETWVAYMSGTPAGYFELEKRPEGDVQIHTFGLLPQFIGRGLGAHLLTRAVQLAWKMDASRVFLGTCSHDHPHALNNYRARGFRVQQTRQGPPNPPLKSFWELMTPQSASK
jgi:ribosomal protein S18 acetylase RimI-like enzyme